MNLETLLKTKAFLEKEQTFFDMADWYHENERPQQDQDNWCGTAACFAGSVVLACGTEEEIAMAKEYPVSTFPAIADKLLGLPLPHAAGAPPSAYAEKNFHFLYYANMCGWPEELQTAYARAHTAKARNRVAIQMTEHLICQELQARRSKIEAEKREEVLDTQTEVR